MLYGQMTSYKAPGSRGIHQAGEASVWSVVLGE